MLVRIMESMYCKCGVGSLVPYSVADTDPCLSGSWSLCNVSVGGWSGTVLQIRTHACPDHGAYVYCFLKTSANLLHRDAPEYTVEQLPDRYPTTQKTDDQISDYSEKR